MRTQFFTTLIFSVFFFSNLLSNTTYPIASSLELKTPGLLHLDESVIKTDNDLQFKFVLKDTRNTNVKVRLRLTVEGSGIRVQSKKDFNPKPILAQYNVPVVLNGMDIAEYFNPDHLDFIGISKEAFKRNGQLPEGTYTVCLEVFDYQFSNDMPLAEKACVKEISVENDPPVLLSPIGEITSVQPQFYNFIWQPRYAGPVLAEYELFIFEKTRGLSVNQVVNITPPVFRTKTFASSYLYTPADPLLKMNQEYLVLVQIKDFKGQVYFKNNGKSKIESFTIIPSCIPGELCDDGVSCTFEDKIVANCECKGTPYYDADKDGNCDPLHLPAPQIVFPNPHDNCMDDESFITLWEPQHPYDLPISYELNIWRTGVDAPKTNSYKALNIKLEDEKTMLSDKLKTLTADFNRQQETASETFYETIKTTHQSCNEEVLLQIENFDRLQNTQFEKFQSNLETISENCGANTDIANNIFQQQLTFDRSSFEKMLEEEKQYFYETLQLSLADYKQQTAENKNDFQVAKQLAFKDFCAQQNSLIQAKCTQQERTAQTFEDRKSELRKNRRACFDEADNFKEKTKKTN